MNAKESNELMRTGLPTRSVVIGGGVRRVSMTISAALLVAAVLAMAGGCESEPAVQTDEATVNAESSGESVDDGVVADNTIAVDEPEEEETVAAVGAEVVPQLNDPNIAVQPSFDGPTGRPNAYDSADEDSADQEMGGALAAATPSPEPATGGLGRSAGLADTTSTGSRVGGGDGQAAPAEVAEREARPSSVAPQRSENDRSRDVDQGRADRPDRTPELDPVADARSALRPTGNTNINLGGAQDFGLFRRRLADGQVPRMEDVDAAGFFAEHHTPLPPPVCGEQVCAQPMFGVMPDIATGEPITMLQIGLNSPIIADDAYRPPLSVAVVVDVSGSMASAGQIDFVRDGLGMLIDRLQDNDQIALITYADSVETVFPMNSVSEHRVELRQAIQGLRARGGTNLHDGLVQGYEEVLANYDSGRQNRVILLSDGQPTNGVTSTPAILNASRAFNSDGVGLTTIGLGSSFNVELMRGLAEQGEGNFYFVENSSAVQEVFADEINYFTVPVAYDLTATINLGPMYRLDDAHGSTMFERTGNGGRLEQESVFLAHRVSHSDVTAGGGRRGGGSALILDLSPTGAGGAPGATMTDIATVDVSFREPGTNRIVNQTMTLTYPGDPNRYPASGYFLGGDTDMAQKSYVMYAFYQAISESISRFHGGDPSGAVGVLERILAVGLDYNDGRAEPDVDVQLDMALVADLLRVMRLHGAPVRVDAQIPSDPWPADVDA